ncbi:unnamed protein product, partial [marine sediment metagenome]
ICKLTKTYVIDKPGKYKLCQDISFCPNEEQKSAIFIDADNVTLDLCNNILSQGNNINYTKGILVKTGHQNIEIHNGIVTKFSQIGIEVQGGQETIKLRSLVVTENGTGAYPVVPVGYAQFKKNGGIWLGTTRTDEYILPSPGFPLLLVDPFLGNINNVYVENVKADKNRWVGINLGEGKNWKIYKSTGNEQFENTYTDFFIEDGPNGFRHNNNPSVSTELVEQSTTITITEPQHNRNSGEKVSLGNFEYPDPTVVNYNGIPGSELLTPNIITVVDENVYTVEVVTSALSSSVGIP